MLKVLTASWRRVDRSLAATLVIAVLFAGAAGAFVPSGDREVGSSATPRTQSALLPLRLVPDTSVAAIMDPASLVLRTSAVDVSPLLQQLVLEKMLAEQRCLAEAMYYEARGEGTDGEKAIAEVIFHRMRNSGFPHTVCGVVYQRAAAGHGCQFSFTCNGELDAHRTFGAWARAKRLAGRILTGLVQLGDETGDAIAFHAVDVEPGWDDHLVRTIQIGNHVFYRAAARTRSS